MIFFLHRSLPVSTVALFVGMCATLLIPQLPNQTWALTLSLCAVTLLSLRFLATSIYLLSVALLGFAFMCLHVNHHLQHMLAPALEGQKITVIGTISSVVEDSKKPKAKFSFKVSEVENKQQAWRLPATVTLSWANPKAKVKPGDVWKLRVKLKRPRNYANPGSFDMQRYFFQQRIAGLGYVTDSAENKLLHRNPSAYPINTVRQQIYAFMQKHLDNDHVQAVLASLLLGIRGNVAEAHMEVWQNTGTAHLLAISGLHIGIIASICFAAVNFIWRYAPQRWLFLPAPWIAACAALVVSLLYALLAGFSIATQRALIMLCVFLCGILFKRKISSVHSYCLALLLVLLWDPFAILSIGFWFSFLAVGFLIYAFRGRHTQRVRATDPPVKPEDDKVRGASRHPGKRVALIRDLSLKFTLFLKPQLVITLGLLPITLLFFAKNSLIGPIANCIAIPWVSFAVLPLGLLALLILPFAPPISSMLLKLSALSLSSLWPILEKLAQLPVYIWQVPEQHLPFMIIAALIGVVWLFAPRGLPGRWWGIFGFAPLLFVQSAAIPYGQAEFTLLDVGQGLATVVRTQNHVLVYDTGAKLQDNFDLGSRVVAPYLQSVGIKKIDALMISHGDNDHAGGAEGLLRKIAAQAVITSEAQTLDAYNPALCQAGQQWEWDGVWFAVLHPDDAQYYKKRNDRSCVLMIQAGEHKALLTGDIEKRSEKELITRYGEELKADLLLVPHHGSKTSSSEEFIQTVNPKYALIPVGYKNQYGHPKEPVLQRYKDLNVSILRTEYDGAISFRLGGDLMPHCYRREQKGFWLHDNAT